MNDQNEAAIFADLANLQQTLENDVSGDRARAVIRYFAEAARDGQTLVQAAQMSQVAAERQMAMQLVECLCASQRVVRKAWELQHGVVLAD